MIRTLLRRLRHDNRGITIVEFAMVAPVLLFFLMGGMDLAYRSFIGATLHGAMQKAARDSTLEDGSNNATVIDNKVTNLVKPIVQNATFTYNRKYFQSFTRAGQAEVFTDSNANGNRDAGECFEDENDSGTWDSVGGRAGGGGADDIVVYNATVSYPRMIPMYGLAGWSSTQTITATTVLRNQPYGNQAIHSPHVVCT